MSLVCIGIAPPLLLEAWPYTISTSVNDSTHAVVCVDTQCGHELRRTILPIYYWYHSICVDNLDVYDYTLIADMKHLTSVVNIIGFSHTIIVKCVDHLRSFLLSAPRRLPTIRYKPTYVRSDNPLYYCNGLFKPSARFLCYDWLRQDDGISQYRYGMSSVYHYLLPWSNPRGIICDLAVERSMLHHSKDLEHYALVPHRKLWIGIVHYYDSEVLLSSAFRRSEDTCLGLFTFSENNAIILRTRVNLPVLSLYHPIPSSYTSWERSNNRLVAIGAWYRKMYSIYQYEVPDGWTKWQLRGEQMDDYIQPHIVVVKPRRQLTFQQGTLVNTFSNRWVYEYHQYLLALDQLPETTTTVEYDTSVGIIDTLNKEDYDHLLNNCVVYLDLENAVAVNTLLECMVHNTPVLVTKLPAIVEYLGEGYPLYLGCELSDDTVIQAHQYMLKLDKRFLSMDKLQESMENACSRWLQVKLE